LGSPVRARNGRELRLEISTTANSRQVALAEAIANQLTPLGFRIAVQPVDLLDLFRERLMPRRYDAALVDVARGGNDGDLYAMWHSSQRQDGLNFAGYGNPTADSALDQLRAESDPDRRQEALLSFQRVWMDDVPSVVLASPLLSYVTSSQIRGVRLGVLLDASARFQHISEWYVRTERVPVIAGWRG
jgi:peptide/nickel transport system substrate-binding protein